MCRLVSVLYIGNYISAVSSHAVRKLGASSFAWRTYLPFPIFSPYTLHVHQPNTNIYFLLFSLFDDLVAIIIIIITVVVTLSMLNEL